MDILIFGASGATGQLLVRQALRQQHRVTAFVRNPATITIRHDRLSVVQGNVNDYIAVERAVKDKDVVLSALGADSMFRYDRVVVDGMENIIKAMQLSGVKRLIYLSFIGVKDSRRDAGFFIRYIASKLLRTEIAGHEAREKMIRQSYLQWTIVQPPALTNGPLRQMYTCGEHITSNAFAMKISRADVADFMLKQLRDDAFVRRAARIMP